MGNDEIDSWSSILVLVFFFLTNLLVIFPLRLPLPECLLSVVSFALAKCHIISKGDFSPRHRHFYLDFRFAPLCSVIILLASGAIDGSDVRGGVLGANGVQPISIMALFISLAYLSISLDATGLLRFLAFWVAQKGGSSGRRLYFYLYAFFLMCGVIVGNDPVILSGTAFLAYLTRVSGISPPTAWIFAQFTAANIASAVLISSNPTNLVISGAFSLPFTTYTAHVVLPALAGAMSAYVVMALVLFRSPVLVPEALHLDLDQHEVQSTLVDKSGAVFGSVLLLITLGVLVGTSTIGVPVWEVTVAPAAIMLARDIWHDWSRRAILREQNAVFTSPIELDTISNICNAPQLQSEKPPKIAIEVARRHLQRLAKKFPTVSTIIPRLPLALLPFAFLMFILVQGLVSRGWVNVFAGWWGAWAEKTGTIGAVCGMGLVGCLLCNICGTNIGATILLARIVQLWLANEEVTSGTRNGTIYALALSSNLGAITLTFSASLAGLLWRGILRQKGIRVSVNQFVKLNFFTVAAASSAAFAVLLGEIYVVSA